MIDLAKARAETPGTAEVIHLNNAGAALMPQPVFDAVHNHLRAELTAGGYEAAAAAADRLDAAYDSAAGLLNCRRDEIAFVENATRAWDMAFYALPFAPGDRILTAVNEYASNYIAFLQAARRHGVSVEAVPDGPEGGIDLAALAGRIDKRVKLIALPHVPTASGTVAPVAAVGRIARDAGALFLLDACQSVGQMPVDVERIGCDMLSTTGRKYLRGPRGTGMLYIRKSLLERLEPPFLDLHAATWVADDAYEMRPDARRFETWEGFVAGRLGLKAAMDYAMGWGPEAIRDRVYRLATRLRAGLAALPGIECRDVGRELCGIVTFTVAGRDPAALAAELRRRRINVSVTTREHTRLDSTARALPPMLRASVHYYNSENELDQLLEALEALSQ